MEREREREEYVSPPQWGLGKNFDFKTFGSLKHNFWEWIFFIQEGRKLIGKRRKSIFKWIFEAELLSLKIHSDRSSGLDQKSGVWTLLKKKLQRRYFPVKFTRGRHIFITILYILRSSYFCEIWALCVWWITYLYIDKYLSI